MSDVKLMDDARQASLLKAAQECIESIALGVAPNAALHKVADDHGMTEKEVDLVSAAVNNSLQLVHHQSGEDRLKTYPMTSSAETNAKRRINPVQEGNTPESTKDKGKAPDALDLAKVSSSYVETGDYRVKLVSDAGASDQLLRDIFGLTPDLQKIASYEEPVSPILSLDQYRVALRDAGAEAAAASYRAGLLMDKVAYELSKVTATSWSEYEHACKYAGVSDDLLDVLYSSLEVTEPRYTGAVKVAREFRSSRQVVTLVKISQELDAAWQRAADCRAAQLVLEAQEKELIGQVFKVAGGDKDGGDIPLLASGGKNVLKLDIDPAQLASSGQALGESLLGDDPGLLSARAFGEHAPEAGGPKAFNELVEQPVRQEHTNLSVRERLDRLMGTDKYIGGHGLPEVADAYNAAMSVNPRFGDAELQSYMRQHLATHGAVPLDLQIRASQAHRDKGIQA